MRHSDLALVLIRLTVKSEPHMLLVRHEKWNDWSLIGGHVESHEKNDWARAAVRECNEELAPLRFGQDFILIPLLEQPVSWGPTKSKSADGELTTYTAQLFALKFLKSPGECLARLPKDDFCAVRESELIADEQANGGVLTVASKALGKFKRVLHAWNDPLPSLPLGYKSNIHPTPRSSG